MSLQKIDTALASAYIAGAFGLPVQWPNESFTSSGTAWSRYSFVPATPGNDTLSRIGRDRYTGFIQIDLNYQPDEGRNSASSKAEEVRAYFSLNRNHSHKGQSVTVEKIGISQGRLVDGWFRISVSVYWRANIQR